MPEPVFVDREASYAEKVDQALDALTGGNHSRASQLLLAVLENMPANYTFADERADGVYMRFWDQEQFVYWWFPKVARMMPRRSPFTAQAGRVIWKRRI